MQTENTTIDAAGRSYDELRAATRRGEPWSFWAAPGESGRLVRSLVARPFSTLPPDPDAPQHYGERVRRALDAIERGVVEKVVVAREEHAPPADPLSTLAELRRRFPRCWIFAVSDGVDVFLGATPELLARVRGRLLETCALAGTSAPGDDRLLHSEKDLREHAAVADAICAELDAVCDEITIAERRVLVLCNVQHLHTPITARLKPGISASDVVARLHPTPAVCGTPRAAARELIRELEPFDRGLYAGVIGYEADGIAEYVVAIRSALLTPSTTRIYAGAGVVRGSVPDDEDAETRAKLRAITEALRPA